MKEEKNDSVPFNAKMAKLSVTTFLVSVVFLNNFRLLKKLLINDKNWHFQTWKVEEIASKRKLRLSVRVVQIIYSQSVDLRNK